MRTRIIRHIGNKNSVTIVKKKGLPYYHCTNNNNNKDNENENFKYSKGRKVSVKDLPKYMNKAKKTFNNLQSNIA